MTNIIGRKRELAELKEIFQTVQQGRGVIAFLAGEAGAGKTLLAEESLSHAGLRVFTGRTAEEATPPYGPVTAVLPLVPGLTEKLERGIEALDIGCGMGRALILMAKAYPNSRFVGYDLCEEPIEIARAEAARQGLANLRFEVRDLTTFDVDAPEAKFDLITSFDAIHDQARPDRVLAGISRALKADGVYLMQDIAGSSEVHNNLDHPLGALLYTVSTMHCMTVSLAQGGMGLGAMWGREKALEMLKEAGFNRVEIKNLDHDIQNNYYIVSKN